MNRPTPSPWRWSALLLMAFASWLNVSSARAQDDNVTGLGGTITLLYGQSDDIAQTRKTIDDLPFGPFAIGGRCEYDCFLWFCDDFTWSWVLDFESSRTAVQASLNDAASYSFEREFTGVRTWLDVDVPTFGVLLTEQSAIIETAWGTNRLVDVTREKNALIAGAVDTLIVRLSTDSDKLGTAIRSLGALGQSQQQLVGGARQAYLTAAVSLQRETDDWNARAASFPCDGDDARWQFSVAARTVEGSLATIEENLTSLELRMRGVDQAADLLIGTLHTLVLNYSGIEEKLRWAVDGTKKGGSLLTLRLNVTNAAWKELADSARAQLR